MFLSTTGGLQLFLTTITEVKVGGRNGRTLFSFFEYFLPKIVTKYQIL